MCSISFGSFEFGGRCPCPVTSAILDANLCGKDVSLADMEGIAGIAPQERQLKAGAFQMVSTKRGGTVVISLGDVGQADPVIFSSDDLRNILRYTNPNLSLVEHFTIT